MLPNSDEEQANRSLAVKKEHAQKPHPMYVQMVLLNKMPSDKLQKQMHYLFGCVPGHAFRLTQFCGPFNVNVHHS